MRRDIETKRAHDLATIGGQTRPLAEWAEIYGKPAHVVHGRVKAGWVPLQALTAPWAPGKKYVRPGVRARA